MDEHRAPNTQLSMLEQSQPSEFVIVIKSDDEAKLVELEEQVASLQRTAAVSSRCKVAKQLRPQLAEARAEVEAHEAQRFESCLATLQRNESAALRCREATCSSNSTSLASSSDLITMTNSIGWLCSSTDSCVFGARCSFIT